MKNFLFLLSIIFVFVLFFVPIIFFDDYLKLWLIIGSPIIIFVIFKIGEYFSAKTEKSIEISGFILLALLNSVTLYFLWLEKHTTNDYKKWENYNHFDDVYSNWMENMPKKISHAHATKNWEKIKWNNLDNGEKVWVKRYFDLYSQEYYFKINKMIPEEMWTELIHGTEKDCKGAAFVHLCEYPILLEGYVYWKDKGAFMHPKSFRTILDKKLDFCEYPKNCKTIKK